MREHCADLTAEEERAGHSPTEAAALALTRLAQADELARTRIERPEMRSWTALAPWAVLGAGPVLGLIAGWGIALLILISGVDVVFARFADALRPVPWFRDRLSEKSAGVSKANDQLKKGEYDKAMETVKLANVMLAS